MNKFILTSLILFFNYTFCTQISSLKDWNSFSPIQWSDFEGPIDNTSEFGAVSTFTQDYTYNWKKTDNKYYFKFKVVCRMHKDKSWSIPASQSSALLQHEQIHFNIAEHIARRLSAKLNSFHFTANYKNQINEIVRTRFITK
jgi:hypothetical protein